MSLVALILIAIASLVVVRIGATAFKMTGLTADVAEFQAFSCFFGVGYTTSEAEMIVSHPARRRIAIHLIVAGNIGLTSGLSALIVTFINEQPGWFEDLVFDREHPLAFAIKILALIAAILLVAVLFRVGIIKSVLERVIKLSLDRSGAVRAMDYDTVLHAEDGYAVLRVEIDPGHGLVGQALGNAGLGHRGVLVIGILRDNGDYVGAPDRMTEIRVGDVLTVYGVEDVIRTECSIEQNPAS